MDVNTYTHARGHTHTHAHTHTHTHKQTCIDSNVTYYGKPYCHFFTRAAELNGISNLPGKRLRDTPKKAFDDF